MWRNSRNQSNVCPQCTEAQGRKLWFPPAPFLLPLSQWEQEVHNHRSPAVTPDPGSDLGGEQELQRELGPQGKQSLSLPAPARGQEQQMTVCTLPCPYSLANSALGAFLLLSAVTPLPMAPSPQPHSWAIHLPF